jgi:hypothetical protein
MTLLLVAAIKKFSERILRPERALRLPFWPLPDYENFLREASFPIIRTRSNADGTGALFFLFFSAFGFFSLAIASQLALCHLVLLRLR